MSIHQPASSLPADARSSMKRFRRSWSRLAALSALASITAFSDAGAQLFEFDDPTLPPSPDARNITHDASTGLDWLDLTVTEGRSFDDIVGNDGTDELGPGGDFEGFRYATAFEVTGWQNGPQANSLYANFSFASSFASIGGFPLVRDFMSYLGCATGANCGSHGFVQGVCVADDTESSPRWARIEASISQGNDFGSVTGCSFTSPQTASPTNDSAGSYGHFLVRVPEPATGLMLATGIGGLAVLAHATTDRRRSRRRAG
ncbi:MAG: PEP-CTERM sorting domain-containing protein [bacterium]|nr:PEP-CTERM sorting domain-containing protein [bacterium]